MSDVIKVLVVEDSPSARELLVRVLEDDPEIKVVATAQNGLEALDLVARSSPDVITMDINMPKMDGFEATRRIMESSPKPIVMVSADLDTREVATTFRAIEAGALAAVRRPAGFGHADHSAEVLELLSTVKAMAEVKVVRRWSRVGRRAGTPAEEADRRPAPERIEVVAIGASTGGPPALERVLAGLPAEFPAPIAVVQHMASGFIRGFVEWLDGAVSLPVHVAADRARMQPGHVYVAPDGLQMKVRSGGTIVLAEDKPENGLLPSVSYLFRSVAETYGRNAIGVLLTGMGRDGAEELGLMKRRGAITFAQDKESSVIFGMPAEAVKLDAATYVLPPERIAATIAKMAAKTALKRNP